MSNNMSNEEVVVEEEVATVESTEEVAELDTEDTEVVATEEVATA